MCLTSWSIYGDCIMIFMDTIADFYFSIQVVAELGGFLISMELLNWT